ncbi:MAG: hypothetical protein JWR37_2049, partial [Mycobacterium sp.]|nr:hypothetical protein [Mycobacterium sp.]
RRSLLGYLEPVCDAVGVGLESCVLDLDTPVSAYVALDRRLTRFPDRDLALIWDERHGWAVAMEPRSGEDLIVVRYLAGPTATPRPAVVADFAENVVTGAGDTGSTEPPTFRPSRHHESGLMAVTPHGSRIAA